MKSEKLKSLVLYPTALVIGIATAFSMAPTSIWGLGLAGIAALYALWKNSVSAAQSFRIAFCFALGYFTTGLWWIGNALLIEGNEFAWVWPLSVIGLPLLLSFFTATYLALARLFSKPHAWGGVFAFALMLTFSDWCRGHAFTGFPWNLYGYMWADTLSMAQGFSLIGAFGMTFLTTLWAAILGYAATTTHSSCKKRIGVVLTVISSMGLLYLWGQARLDGNPTAFNTNAGVVVVQPNIPQTMKWDPDATQDNFIKTLSLSEKFDFGPIKPRSVFIIWPETAISPSIYMDRNNVDRMQAMLRSYTDSDAYLITGMLFRDDSGEEAKFSNSIAFLDRDMNTLALYSKFHLVPFGEFIPFQNLIPIKAVTGYSGFERGAGPTTISRANVPPFSPLVCYEVIFPDDIAAKFANVQPQWIVNATNDGWYGVSAGPFQHFAQTRLRAIESGIPVMRSANTGMSGIIDAYGRIIDSAPLNQEASLVSLLPRALENRSPFWPWALQPLLFLASLAYILTGVFSNIIKIRSRL